MPRLLNDTNKLLPDRKTELYLSSWFTNRDWFESAYLGVHGYYNGNYKNNYWSDSEGDCCVSECDPGKAKVLDKHFFKGSDRLKCHECDQLFYARILDSIIQGKEYSEIAGFDMLLSDASQCVIWNTDINKNISNKPFNENLIEVFGFTLHGLIECPDRSDHEGRLSEFVNGLVGYSLTNFLLKNDRRKIKKCQKCDIYYLSKTTRQSIYCSDKCRRDFHNRQRIEDNRVRSSFLTELNEE